MFLKFLTKAAKAVHEGTFEKQANQIQQTDEYYEEFHDENGNFRYPKFNSPPGALIKIKDTSCQVSQGCLRNLV